MTLHHQLIKATSPDAVAEGMPTGHFDHQLLSDGSPTEHLDRGKGSGGLTLIQANGKLEVYPSFCQATQVVASSERAEAGFSYMGVNFILFILLNNYLFNY
jgi:hypothetical protein